MEFEFDPAKSAANRDKHGLDFVEAQEMWDEPGWIQALPYNGEPREMRTALIKMRVWSAVYTMRGARIRLISVRRARWDEEEDYGRFIAEQRDDDEH